MLNYHRIHISLRLVVVTGLAFYVYKYFLGERERPSRLTSKEGGDESDLEADEDSGQETDDLSDYEDDEFQDKSTSEDEVTRDVIDIEDMGIANRQKNGAIAQIKVTRQSNRTTKPIDYSQFEEEQLTDKLRSDLSKQGYRLLGSHSAVKICRWTKNSMRGRGGCYKHTFYGIMSFQCMEMTPNLACASKCTFCWRHHKNPVGTEWRWKVEQPEVIVDQALQNHLEMIAQLKGVPGVTKDRFLEAQTVRHCALSLVGEPIQFPYINRLLEILHDKKISTFLVTNAQFPEAMENLIPITQLYVSIDASNKETLKKIDRPLYKDFWERYIKCLEILSKKKQRTVFRLTLVLKADDMSGNMNDIEGYTKLVEIGNPDFIELKAVTYCGTSKANKLTMKNVPWHEQVVKFAKELCDQLPHDKYDLAGEHSHSNSVLIANKKFKINGKWHTWIDYQKFFQLIELYKKENKEFDSLDYAAETPSWALYGSQEAGFDPSHKRFIRRDHKLELLKQRLEKLI